MRSETKFLRFYTEKRVFYLTNYKLFNKFPFHKIAKHLPKTNFIILGRILSENPNAFGFNNLESFRPSGIDNMSSANTL